MSREVFFSHLLHARPCCWRCTKCRPLQFLIFIYFFTACSSINWISVVTNVASIFFCPTSLGHEPFWLKECSLGKVGILQCHTHMHAHAHTLPDFSCLCPIRGSLSGKESRFKTQHSKTVVIFSWEKTAHPAVSPTGQQKYIFCLRHWCVSTLLQLGSEIKLEREKRTEIKDVWKQKRKLFLAGGKHFQVLKWMFCEWANNLTDLITECAQR